jgi:hypothetical protein
MTFDALSFLLWLMIALVELGAPDQYMIFTKQVAVTIQWLPQP